MRKHKERGPEKQILPRMRVTTGGEIALGPGKIRLLELLERTGSIVKAAKRMDMSYMRAWVLIRTMNKCFRKPLVITERGGKSGGGGAVLTKTGREALALYHQIHAGCLRSIQPGWRKLRRLLR